MGTALNVLLAEDDVEDKILFTNCLKKLDINHNIKWAKDYDELFQILETEPEINLAIVDLDIPGKKGKECLKEIKAKEKEKGKNIPVVVLTISKKEDDIDEVYENGAHFYAIKPYHQANFLETLREIFKIDWKEPPPIPDKKDFIINHAFA